MVINNIDDIVDELNRLDAEEQPKSMQEEPAVSVQLNVKLLKEFAKIDTEISDMELKLKMLKKRKAEIDPVLQEQFASAGIQNINVDGRTVYISTKIWAKKEDGVTDADVVEALKQAGLGDSYVAEKFNHQSLSALIREWVNNDEPFPEVFKGIIGYVENVQVTSRKAG